MPGRHSRSGRGRGPTQILFIVLLVFLGALAWLFWEGGSRDFTRVSAELDDRVTSLLVKSGIGDGDIVSQFRRERRAGTALWIEFEREIRLPPAVKADSLAGRIRKLAGDTGFDVSSTKGSAAEAVTLEISSNARVFSRLRLSPASEAKEPRGPVAALVLDDAGYHKDLSRYLELGIPITFAILPRERHSGDLARELSARNMPYILHLPLEPEGYPQVNPGSAAVLTSMGPEEIRSQFDAALASVPGARGINNHMGSRFSADLDRMNSLLALVNETGLFYLDSYTTPKTKARLAAQETGTPFLQNELFLDLKDDPEFMRKQFATVLSRAKRRGICIAIGHVHKKHMAEAIKEAIPRFREEGVEFVYVTDLLDTERELVRSK